MLVCVCVCLHLYPAHSITSLKGRCICAHINTSNPNQINNCTIQGIQTKHNCNYELHIIVMYMWAEHFFSTHATRFDAEGEIYSIFQHCVYKNIKLKIIEKKKKNNPYISQDITIICFKNYFQVIQNSNAQRCGIRCCLCIFCIT